MIATLLTHEFRRTKGMAGLIMGAVAALVLVGSVLAATGWPLLARLGFYVAVVCLAGLLPALNIGLAVDYWRSAYGRVGYFTQSLPVRGSRIYLVRLLYAFIVSVVTTALAALLAIPIVLAFASVKKPASVGLLAYVRDNMTQALAELPDMAPALIVCWVVLSMWSGFVFAYAAATIGSGPVFARLGVVGPFLAYALLYGAAQIALAVGIFLAPIGIGMRGNTLSVESFDFLQAALEGAEPQVMPVGFVPVVALGTLALIAWTAWSWNRRVSLR
ncbi:hypothetical protein [Gephyromycinifex aptenodytis]|uniref:hypothetical protein n=1 Tax=Gephyromycinifex aptenodytis TaxID=2716227 RepID=UPI001446322F|nr:hypothetical protein [Gephyromycinifex aptenodytis]